ncbi:hypothetical protein GCM10009647_071940 [Streptomyces sanglieri]
MDLDSGVAQVFRNATVIPWMIPGFRLLPQRVRVEGAQPELYGTAAGVGRRLAGPRFQ